MIVQGVFIDCDQYLSLEKHVFGPKLYSLDKEDFC